VTRPPVSFSALKRIAQSPAHYLAGLHGTYDSPAMRLGRLVHQMVLGGPPPLVWEGERRGNAWKSFRELHGAADIVTSSEVELATRIADAVASCPVARPYLTGRHEVPV
jgi:hypothetical protein